MVRNIVVVMYRVDWRDDDRVGEFAKDADRGERAQGRMWKIPGRGGARNGHIVLVAGHGAGGLEALEWG